MFVPLKIQSIWDRVPEMDCKGLCTDSCGPIDCSDGEKAVLRAHGVDLTDVDDETLIGWLLGNEKIPSCPALVDGRCTVYEVRPLICRLWGSTPRLACPHGCVPKGGHMDDETAGNLIREME